MTENVDIIEVFEKLQFIEKLVVKYRFKRMPYLVADKYGNFFILPHFNNRRTTEFKMLDSSGWYVYYNGIKYYLSRLRKRAIITDELTTK